MNGFWRLNQKVSCWINQSWPRSGLFKLHKSYLIPLLFIHSSGWTVPAQGQRIMVSGPSPHVVEVAQRVTERGGNVADVAVAIGLTLSVTSPYYAALGGGGFALIKMDEKVRVLDFREVAPKATGPDYYLNLPEGSSQLGGTAVAVPGIPMGLWELHQKYGQLRWAALFDYPLRLANQGFRVSGEWSEMTERAYQDFSEGGKQHFTKVRRNSEATPEDLYGPGEVLRQRALGQALRMFRRQGPRGFYQGAVARDIVRAVKETGGQLSLEDLEQYRVRWLEPMVAEFQGHTVYLMPPPSSGGLVIKTALHLMESLKLPDLAPLSHQELHLLGEIMSRSFRGRALLADPDFHSNPLEALLSSEYLKSLKNSIDPNRARSLEPLSEDFGQKARSEEAGAPGDRGSEFLFAEATNTTHYSVMDQEGRAIAVTVTLNGNYGSKVVSPRYGIALNNEMDDFTTRPGEPNMFGLVQGTGNRVTPGKRPLSSMSPTLVEKDGQVIMAIGSPGGPRIISGVLQVLYRSLVTGLDIDQAIQFPRIHHQFLPNTLFVEPHRLPPESLEALRKKGHDLREVGGGRVYAVRLREDGRLEGAHDLRGEGASGGF